MKKISALIFSLTLATAVPAIADDFGARFGGAGSTALEDSPNVADIEPAAGDEAMNPEAQADMEAETADDEASGTTSTLIQAPAAEPQAGTEATLEGPSEPEPTPQEQTESDVIHQDEGMSPNTPEDPSYRLQDTSN